LRCCVFIFMFAKTYVMTPKEKALQLVEKYLCVDETYNVDLFCDECGISNDAAKYCALIAVDEILNQENAIVPQLIKIIKKLMYSRSLNEKFEGDVNIYWKEVKKEIEKL
jgi:hypothetical protein